MSFEVHPELLSDRAEDGGEIVHARIPLKNFGLMICAIALKRGFAADLVRVQRRVIYGSI
jgi:hypothetical protein